MKTIKGLACSAAIMAGAMQTATAIPTFTELATAANNAGGNINISSFNHTAIADDALWSKLDGAAVKFKAEISGYDNAMGYANADGSDATIVLNEGDSGWHTLAGAPDPFTFFLDTQQGNQWFSDTSLNADGLDHLLAFQKKDGSDRYILFWDDQYGGGDRDFNDFVARVNFVSPVAVSEPGSLALIGLGLIGLGLARKKTEA